MSEVNAGPDGQPAGHYHQSLVSPWGIVVAAHGKANDNHILVLGESFFSPAVTTPLTTDLLKAPSVVTLAFYVQCKFHACAEALPSQPPKLLEILDDSLAIRIPLAADYTDNFVNGVSNEPLSCAQIRAACMLSGPAPAWCHVSF